MLDSGTNIHLCGSPDLLTNRRPVAECVRVASGKIERASAKGTVGDLRDVRVTPGGSNLVSIGKLIDDASFGALFTRTGVHLGKFTGETTSRLGSRTSNGLHRLSSTSSPHHAHSGEQASTRTPGEQQIRAAELPHARLGPISHRKLARGVKAGTINSEVPPAVFLHLSRSKHACIGCSLGKLTQTPFRRRDMPSPSRPMATKPLQRVSIDTCIVNNSNHRKHTCFLIIIDECSHYSWCFPMKRRADAPQKFPSFVTEMRAHHPSAIVEAVRSDGAKEFIYSLDKERCTSRATMEVSAPHRSCRTNPQAERCIRTITQMARGGACSRVSCAFRA